MQRKTIEPRQNWSREIEQTGFDFYKDPSGVPYWNENAYYEFAAAEIDVFEEAANTLHGLCLQACERIVAERLWPLLGIEAPLARLVEASWTNKDPDVYGRFDLIYDGSTDPKMLEYNADTPTSLFESSIVQWNWREQIFPKADQFNSIHEHLVDRFRAMLAGKWTDDGRGGNAANRLVVTCPTPTPEDECTVQYIGGCATEAGWETKFMPIQSIGWNGRNFTDLDESKIFNLFKLYPWEWLARDPFGANIPGSGSVWMEPMWKMMISNKGILPILWEMFPQHPNLLPAFRDSTQLQGQSFVKKPFLGREGQNITIQDGSKVLQATDGEFTFGKKYGDLGGGMFVYQGFAESAVFEGRIRPNLGVWVVGGEACGMGVREDDNLIVSNTSRYVPHIFN